MSEQPKLPEAYVLVLTGFERPAHRTEWYQDRMTGRPMYALNGTMGPVPIMLMRPAVQEADGRFKMQEPKS